jgi:hypothetical protein
MECAHWQGRVGECVCESEGMQLWGEAKEVARDVRLC